MQVNTFLFFKECKDNTYGERCIEICGNCLNGQPCDHINGNCPNGCDKGTYGDKCDKGMSRRTHPIWIFSKLSHNDKAHNLW